MKHDLVMHIKIENADDMVNSMHGLPTTQVILHWLLNLIIFDVYGDDLWDLMFLANYQFVDWFGATFRYSHEDLDPFVGFDSDADRFTLAFSFSYENLFLNFEYSHTEIDSGDDDADEFLH